MINNILMYKYTIIFIIIFFILNYFNISFLWIMNFEIFNNINLSIESDKFKDIYNILLTFYLTFISISVWLFWVIVSMNEVIKKVNLHNPKAVKNILWKFKLNLILFSLVSILLLFNYILVIVDNDIISNLIKEDIIFYLLFFIIFLLETLYSIFKIFLTILYKFIKN